MIDLLNLIVIIFDIIGIIILYIFIGIIVIDIAEKQSTTLANNFSIGVFCIFVWPIVLIVMAIGILVSFIKWIIESKKVFIEILKDFVK